MIFPREEKLKYEKLQRLLDNLKETCKKLEISTYYDEKFITIIKCASQKLVGCTDELPIMVDSSNPKGVYQLRRKGLVIQFGYSGDRYKIPDYNYLSKIIIGPHSEREDNRGFFKKFSTALQSLQSRAQNPAGVGILLQALQDIKATKFYKNTDGWSSNTSDLAIEGSRPLVVPLEIQASEEIEEERERDFYDDASLTCSVSASKVLVNLKYDELELKFLNAGTKKEEGFIIKERICLSDYIRISEPATYDYITKLILDLTAQVNAKVSKEAAHLDVVLEKYGHFLCYKEL
jgi:hypothetical protein